MGTGGPFPGGKARPVSDNDHALLSSAEVVNEYELYLLSPLRLHRCGGTALPKMQRRMMWWLMNNELERIWKEVIVE
jgi:hypothetical protein